jgi:hypothetical protein
MKAIGLKLFVGTKKMCMFHEPEGFWPNIFQSIYFFTQKVTILYLGWEALGGLMKDR